jgi:hypothetical protein
MDRADIRGAVAHACATCILSLIVAAAEAQSLLTKGAIPNPSIPVGPWKRVDYVLARAESEPKIDGILDDECWKTATHAPAFFRFQSPEPIHEQTEAWMCASRTHLFIGIHCKDSHPELIRQHETQREGDLSHDDWVGLAIDSQGTHRNVSQFEVSARGTQVTQLEGATADNLTWAGEWKAATHRVEDGWTAEISIPFSILRYPKNTKEIGIALIRVLARETNAEIWPYVPPEGNNNPLPFLSEFSGINPPKFAPRWVVLPYVLGVAGPQSTLTGGVDLKYPVSTTLTGVGTLFPDFRTVEQAVSDLSFSYTEKYVPDRRPFFVEGSNYLQDSFLFYSQRIPFVDEGAKLVGKEGNTTISALATNTSQAGGQTAAMANVAQDLGLFSQVGAAVLSNDSGGQPSNQLARFFGQYGSMQGARQNTIQGNVTGSWLQGSSPDKNDWVQVSSYAGHGTLGGSAFYTETGPGFVNQLGLVPEVDLRGTGFSLSQYDNLDRGKLETYQVSLAGSTYRHMTDGFFHDDMSLNSMVMVRSGWAYEFDLDAGKYEPYVDNTVTTAVSWNQKTLLQQGRLALQVGHREDQPYQFLSLTQGILVSKPFSLQLAAGYEKLDGAANTQTILTGTYRLNSMETIGGRLLQQNGDVDVYLSYGRKVLKGTDVFVLIGDPNSPRTKGQVILKLVWPF